MKYLQRSFFVLGLSLIFAPTTFAQVDLQRRFPGYEASVIDESQVNDVFNRAWQLLGRFSRSGTLGSLDFRNSSQCFHRATVWNYLMDRELGIKSQKLFVYYSFAFKEYYKKKHSKHFDWWFHVAPLVLVKTSSGKIEERVIDPTFADGPLTVKAWTDLFIESKKTCRDGLIFNNYGADVAAAGSFPRIRHSNNASAHCFIGRSTMYDLDPPQMQARQYEARTGQLGRQSQVLSWGDKIAKDNLDEAASAFSLGYPRNQFRKYSGVK